MYVCSSISIFCISVGPVSPPLFATSNCRRRCCAGGPCKETSCLSLSVAMVMFVLAKVNVLVRSSSSSQAFRLSVEIQISAHAGTFVFFSSTNNLSIFARLNLVDFMRNHVCHCLMMITLQSCGRCGRISPGRDPYKRQLVFPEEDVLPH